MQLSSAELIVTIVSAIVGLLMGFVSGAMPLQPQRMTPVQATVQKVLGFAIVAVVVVLALASMNVACGRRSSPWLWASLSPTFR